VDVNNGSALYLAGPRAVIDRLDLGSETENGAPGRQVGLKKAGQDDAAAVLPLLHGGRCLSHHSLRVAGDQDQGQKSELARDGRESHRGVTLVDKCGMKTYYTCSGVNKLISKRRAEATNRSF